MQKHIYEEFEIFEIEAVEIEDNDIKICDTVIDYNFKNISISNELGIRALFCNIFITMVALL